MFQIIKIDGETLGYVDDVRYIKRNESGDFIKTDTKNAIGIAFKGEPFMFDEIIVKEVDGGKVIEEINAAYEEKQTINEIAMVELAETQAADQTANELALVELAETIGG